MSGAGDITQLLHAASAGDAESQAALFEALYSQLRDIAQQQRRRWKGNETLDTVALLNEAYVRLIGNGTGRLADRAHFFATAATAMRQILMNYARATTRQKRGGGALRVTFADQFPMAQDTVEDLLQVDSAIDALRENSNRAARVFECRVFGGMTLAETASALNVSLATVKRDWQYASSWIYSRIDAT